MFPPGSKVGVVQGWERPFKLVLPGLLMRIRLVAPFVVILDQASDIR